MLNAVVSVHMQKITLKKHISWERDFPRVNVVYSKKVKIF